MKSWIKITLGVVLVIGLAGFGTGLYLMKKGPRNLKKVNPDYIITAVDLQKAFEKDETSASTRYVNKILEVSGVIGSVETGENNALNISLKTANDLTSIICTLPIKVSSDNLSPGKQVTIRGECSGYLMDVLLNNCVIIK